MPSPIGIALQDRDLALLRTLFESRIMTAGHVASLHFEGRGEAAKKRLWKLKNAGLIGERARRVFEPSVLCLTRKAFTLLREQGVLIKYPGLSLDALEKRARVSDRTIDHELEVMDVKAAFHAKLRPGFAVASFSTWPALYEFEASKSGYGGASVLVKPDAFIRIHEKEADGGVSEHSFFLELDRSSETLQTLVSRASCYFHYYKYGDFAVRQGGTPLEFKDYPFRVLMVFKSAERRNNTAAKLLQNHPPLLSQTCLSTFDEVITNPFGEIWIRPLDYRQITKGTPFDTELPAKQWGYRREMERELFVEAQVKKFSILF